MTEPESEVQYLTESEITEIAESMGDAITDMMKEIVLAAFRKADPMQSKKIDQGRYMMMTLYPLSKAFAQRVIAYASMLEPDKRSEFILHCTSCHQQTVDKIIADGFQDLKEREAKAR